ncbi:GNAT family N-acetyltransferase [Muricauda sp. 334s03]|uniref:GNAT family N-acetyltransferase n=1 Tax=Flagellimonas yonaguniensis TaxID=3031325 RepID=A0ABT5XZ00_9FLAO|nr:GNAT family N-acetyltransferase [[Muricauda] yonaguniensis]MDF0716420.1 GNAT family N-acetyltransferase [[Muricauda] yonaguniensis]
MKELLKEDYSKVIGALKEVKINNLFARAVVENHVSGKVYVDDVNNPTTVYVIHPYGMSLLFGKHDNQAFNRAFKDYALNKENLRDTHEWMQAYPEQWDSTLKELFADCSIKSSDNDSGQTKNIVELNTRVNFKFNPEKYASLKKDIKVPTTSAVRTGKQEFESMQGTVIPLNFWNNADDFIDNAIGYSTYYENELACTAYASVIIDKFLELGMETVPKFRGKGLARYTCSKLIDHCLKNDYEPIWACRLENIGSYTLAQKLGFEDVLQIPYYRLSN